MTQIIFNSINKSFGKTHVIKDVSIEIEPGEFVVFVGPSGCGKSTLLRLIAGLEEISSGNLIIGNREVNDLSPKERGIAMVFQSYALYPHMTVFQNMAFGLTMGRKGKEEVKERVMAAAKVLELEDYLKRRPAELSGGQRQRVAIGRAIVRKPEVFLFDEPLSNLDAALRVQTRLEIAKLHQELQTTIIYVTHDQVEAMTLADKIVVLKDGRVEQVGSPLDIYHQPANQFVAGFIGSPKMNFISAMIKEISDTSLTVELQDQSTVSLTKHGCEGKIGEAVTVGIRPEHLFEISGESPIQLSATVEVIEHLGDMTYLYTRQADDTRIIASVSGTSPHKKQQEIILSAAEENIHLFNEQGRM